MEKNEIDRPEPGTLPPRISFIEQMGGSAGYYVRFQEIPEEEGGPIRKYIPILQYESQDEALEAAIAYRDEMARRLDVGTEPAAERQNHSDEVRENMSDSHNRIGLRGLGLTLSNSGGTIYPTLSALWSEEEGQRQVRRSTVQRGIWKTVKALVPYLQEHIHEEMPAETLLRRGATGAAKRLQKIAHSADPNSKLRKRLESLFEKWAQKSEKDRALLEMARPGEGRTK